MRWFQCIGFFGLLLLLPGCASTQQQNLAKQQAAYDIVEKIVDVHIDNLENIYILTKGNKILKYRESLDQQFDYSNNQIGEIESIDATNPQKILCFIKDFNRILVLDNTLAEINTIDLSISEYLDVSVVARSNDNQIWLFDPISQTLVKVNDLVQKQTESNRLTDLNLGMIDPVHLVERGNIVAMTDPKLGILIFDNFGQFIRLIPEKDIDYVQIFGKYLFFVQNGVYYQYYIDLYEKSEMEGMQNGFSRFFISKLKTYYIDENGISVKDN
ncbi:MAG: hypothetical protein P1U56_07570 [Saprospiraceae bacterium]|nr:hypothetical protein [Saprospiraceae bacterium]